MDPLAQLARNIRAARNAAGLTQDSMAGEMGFTSVTSYNRWERGTRTPTVASLVRLAEVLGTTTAVLMDGVGPEIKGGDIDEAVRLLRGLTPERRAAAVRVIAEFAGT